MADDFDDFFRPDAEELPADGVAPARRGGVIVVESEAPMCAEEFEARWGGPYVLHPVEFDDLSDINGADMIGTMAPALPPDPALVAAADLDDYKRWPIIEAACTLGPNLSPNATPAEIAARKVQFEKAIIHFRRVQADAAR